MKKCNKCRKIKNTTEFFKDRSSRDGLYSICKRCKVLEHSKWVKLNRLHVRASRKEWIRNTRWASAYNTKKKLVVLTHYSRGVPRCSCCGERHIEFLAIDHTNGGGTRLRRSGVEKSGVAFYLFLIRHDFPSGFRVLCHNCNQANGNYGKCPHKKRCKQ